MKRLIIAESGERVFNFITQYVDVNVSTTVVLSTTSRFNVDILDDDKSTSIINLKRINDIKHLNKFFESCNNKLPQDGVLIGCAETTNLRKRRIFKKFPPVINFIYYTLDFILKRVFPKLPITKKIYFFITNGRNRVLSRAEIFGRIYSCGFELVKEEFLNNNLFFVARKIKEPFYDHNPSYGPLVKMRRIGRCGKIIYVYKLRTMHPYAEYIQEYVFDTNQLAAGGKIKNDFRVTTLGKFFRKFWLDELPMFINFFKGELKLVGVRPLSEHYFSLYSDDLKKKRYAIKPGLIPPFYADMPKSLDDIMASELNYINKWEKNHFTTDFLYFFKAFYNIVFRRARSK